jgi:hypothetical protein
MVVSEGGGSADFTLHPGQKLPGPDSVALPYISRRERAQYFPGSAPAVVQSFAEQCEALAAEKDALYGGAWQRQGYMGNMARVLSKIERLREMVWRDGELSEGTTDETIIDTLRDLSNIAAFMAENINNGNRWGEK